MTSWSVFCLYYFRKAFDVIDHELLLKKMYMYGADPPSVAWFKSYWSEKKRFIQYSSLSDDLAEMERWARGNKPYTGAPDGSVPHNICSACKFLLAGTFGKNDTSLEGKCCWERDSAGCWREFVVWSTCYVVFIRRIIRSKLACNFWIYVCWETSQ